MNFFIKQRETDQTIHKLRKLSLFGKHMLLGKAIISTLANNYQELKDRIINDQTRLDDPSVQALLHLISVKNAKQRSPMEIDFLKACLASNRFFNFVHSFVKKKQTLDQFYKNLTIRELNPSELLFKHGDLSTELFIVMYGEVIVMLPRQIDKPLPRQFNFLTDKAVQTLHTLYEDCVIVNQIMSGTYFGEVGLIHKIPRTATIVASPQRTKVLLAVYTIDIFYQYIQPLLSLQMREKIDLLKQVPQLHNLSKKQLSIFCAACMEKNFRLGQNVFIENEPGSFLYIITNGQVEFYKIYNGREILLYQTQQFSIIGGILNERGNYWMGAKASSAFVQVFKISNNVLISQLEKWGCEIIEPDCKEEWIRNCYENQIKILKNQQSEDSIPVVEIKKPIKMKAFSPLKLDSHITSKLNIQRYSLITDAINEHQQKLQKQLQIPVQRKRKIEKIVSDGDQLALQYCNDIRQSSQKYFFSNFKQIPLKTQSSQKSVRIQNSSGNLYDSVQNIFGKADMAIEYNSHDIRQKLKLMMKKKFNLIKKQDKFKELQSFDIKSLLHNRKGSSLSKTSHQSRRISIKK